MTVYRSGFPALDYPEISITELVMRGLARRGPEPVLVDGPSGQTLTGDVLAAMIRGLAGGLAARGIGRGDVVAIMAPNLPEYAAVFHGVAWAGATITTVNPSYTAPELHHQLVDSGARLLVTVPPLLETARAAAAGTRVAEISVIGAAPDATPLEALIGPPLAGQAAVDLRQDVVAVPYSSGTTGLPKGVMLTHANMVANVLQTSACFDVVPGLPTLAFLPYFHIYGMTALLNHYLSRGAVQITMPRFDLEAALGLIERHRVRHLFVVPPVVLALARHPAVADFDLSSLEFVLSGAAPLGAELSEACAARLGCEMLQGYGMTELSPVSHAVPQGRPRAGAAGLALADTECRLVDPATGVDVAAGEAGELWVRGPQVMKGYHANAQATAATLDADGWLHTGDLASIGGDGYLFVVDRVKELIKFKGFQVAPAELEALLVAHPDIADAAVVGAPDEEAGEVPVAFILAAGEQGPDLEAVQDYLSAHVASYKQIRKVIPVDAIPKSPSGKILRRLLRERIRA